MPTAPASCPVAVPGRGGERRHEPEHGRIGAGDARLVRYCGGPPCWRRGDGVWFCGLHTYGHVHLRGAAGDLGWWRVERDIGREAFWLLDDRPGGGLAYVFPLDAGRWSCAGVAWENEYGPEGLSALLAPAVRWVTSR